MRIQDIHDFIRHHYKTSFYDGWFKAAELGCLSVIHYILSRSDLHVDIDARRASENGPTALHIAAYYGHLPVVKYLHQNGAHLVGQTSSMVATSYVNALFLAVHQNREHVVEYLYSQEHLKMSVCASCESVLQYAVSVPSLKLNKLHRGYAMVALLVKLGCDVHADLPNKACLVDSFMKYSIAGLSLVDQRASLVDQMKILSFLLDQKVDVCSGQHTIFQSDHNGKLIILKRLDNTCRKALSSLKALALPELRECLKKHDLPVVLHFRHNTFLYTNQSSDPYAQSFFHWASFAGYDDLVKLCWGLDGGDPFKMIDGMTPLHIAVSQGHVSMVGWMLDQDGIDLFRTDGRGRHLLQIAAEDQSALCNCTEMEAFLRMKNLFSVDERGTYHLSANEINPRGSLLVVVDFRHDDQTDTSPDLHRDAQGKTDLMHAVMHVDFEAVVRLVDAGSDVNARSYAGLVVLDYTFYAQRYELQPKLSTQQRQIMQYLIDQGADMRRTHAIVLHPARLGDVDCLRFLCQRGADINHSGDGFDNAFREACTCGHAHVVRYLLSGAKELLGIRVDLCDFSFGRSPLHWAVSHGHLSIVKMLWDHQGVNKDRRDQFGGMNVWHLAVFYGQLHVLEWLVSCMGVDWLVLDADHKNLLHQAVVSEAVNRFEVADFLLDIDGCPDSSHQGSYSLSPVDLAHDRSDAKMVSIFDKHSENKTFFENRRMIISAFS